MIKRFSVFIYWAIMIALIALFFTNDYGIVDIHKSAIIVAVGIDPAGEEVQVTAQLALPQPSQSGENVQYKEVQGSGLTVADALNEINSKTGFYPRLQFCKLILLGEGCQQHELFRILGCFYRRNYSELTALVAMCEGKAQDMLAMPATVNPETYTAVQRVLSEELAKSANVASVNLKDVAVSNYSESEACCMPYIQASKPGTSQSGGNGDNVGGESAGGGSQSGGQSGGQSSGQSGGQSGGQGGGQGGGQSSGQSGGSASGQSGGEGQPVDFTSRKTAVFTRGKFAGLLDEQQSFAYNILKNNIRLAVLPCDSEGIHYTVGLKNTTGGVKLKVKNGVPELTLKFKANAQIQGVKNVMRPEEVMYDDVIQKNVLRGAEKAVEERFGSLIKMCVEKDCDILGAKELLHKYNHKYWNTFRGDLLTRMKVNYDVEIISHN